ncbi:site-specific DNA-methyltransferase [Gudongella oleilytica]|uniref:site-specific DNA-methyltransferase n=1 Tax=Gudongella oleilytica TaxID=1582259 RepID=UPI002A366959|nr:site-specific DNA-methyltransferase [Gudongella oleilytica]MDY0256212.1 site-specific DNA-methyltransferase [Gudongella oleilytica]
MQKLELTWIGKGDEPVVEPRILLHDASKDYGDPAADNMLIHGDNLLALKALEQEFAGRVKCIYIDPPYNTGSAFEHYDDNLEHSTWLSLMVPRLRILRNLMSDDGSIWISIDDDEGHYLKVLCDEVFGRQNFVSTVLWQKIHSLKNDAKYLSSNHDFVLVYAKNKELISFNLLPRTDEMNNRYKNPDNDPRGPWQSGDLVANEERANGYYDVVSPTTGKVFNVQQGKHWVYSQENMIQMIADNRIWFGNDGNAFPRKKRFLSEVMDGRKGDTWWTSTEVGHNQEAKREIIKLFGATHVFATPKPERLIQRVLTLGSSPGDLVLDSFLGSGTTAAVAHKMGRRYIGIELGEHCYTHCLPRLQKVVDGEEGGISKTIDWQGGGGFKFYELAPTLIVKDAHGQPIINDKYNAQMLVAAIAKLNGYDYAPDAEVFWKQGKSQVGSYIFVTTEYITAAQLDDISRDLPEYERLLICAPAFDIGLGKRYENINVRKIPQSVLDKCEYGADNYNLNIVNPPELDEDEWGDGEDA